MYLYPLDLGVVIFTTVIYLLCPERFIPKNEYVKFFLLTSSLYLCLLFVLFELIRAVSDRDAIIFVVRIFTAPTFYLAHRLYPFKRVKRNRHISFFLVCISVYFIVEIGGIFILHALAVNM
ncbi:hypothetical protein EZS27_016334 [termite gut metagenome]|uniref:Uncharacterized protein n=1 Tax=termite gut metagenome TaxID=433724 RepID=A0A5J4RPR7_9ZZZZ